MSPQYLNELKERRRLTLKKLDTTERQLKEAKNKHQQAIRQVNVIETIIKINTKQNKKEAQK